ncbi:hypothetical protein QUC31_011586 [Theobroma cacao]
MMKMGNLIKKLIFDEYEEVRDKQMEKEAGSEAGKLALFSCLSLKQSVGHNTTIHNIAPGNKKYGLVLLFFTSSGAAPLAPTYSVLNYGAKPDGNFDSAQAFVAAWTLACGSINPATIYVPPGRFLLRNVVFRGQCKNSAILFSIDGTLVAPSNYNIIGNTGNWLIFEHVNGVSIYGGILDGQGVGLWTCKSIGSLGKEFEEPGVQNVTVKSVTFTGTQNGVRIKSWGRPSTGYARNILFQHAVMTDVENPIVIDQHYCPDEKNCPGQVSGVKISDVTYQDIHGTSATEVALKFDCSSNNPCTDIRLDGVKLTYKNRPAEAACSNADGTASGFVQASSCL